VPSFPFSTFHVAAYSATLLARFRRLCGASGIDRKVDLMSKTGLLKKQAEPPARTTNIQTADDRTRQARQAKWNLEGQPEEQHARTQHQAVSSSVARPRLFHHP